jgi:hypothetical protein
LKQFQQKRETVLRPELLGNNEMELLAAGSTPFAKTALRLS